MMNSEDCEKLNVILITSFSRYCLPFGTNEDVKVLLCFVTDATHLVSRQAPNKEAMPIAIAKSARSSAQCWNHSWQASPKCFPYTIATSIIIM